MFDRFSDSARKVMGLARKEAQRFNHEHIGTEHILLALIQGDCGVAADVLKSRDVDLKRIRQEVEKLVSHGKASVTAGQLSFRPCAKKVLELALKEASSLGHHYIGTEHLLLGLIRGQEGIAADVLDNIGVDTGTARTKVRELLGAEPELAPRTQYSVLSGPARPRKENARLLEMLRNLEEQVRELEAERAGRDGEFWKEFGN